MKTKTTIRRAGLIVLEVTGFAPVQFQVSIRRRPVRSPGRRLVLPGGRLALKANRKYLATNFNPRCRAC